jgi:hypothetical protein
MATDIEGGGSITNNAGGSIAGGAFGVFLTGGPGTVTNAGTISGASYSVFMGTNAGNRLVVDPGAVFNGAVGGGGGMLELASGSGAIGGINNGSFLHFQSVVDDNGGNWTLSGTNAVSNLTNNGTLAIAGALDVSTAVDPSSTGLFQIGSGAIFEVGTATGSQASIGFLGSSELLIDNAASFGTNVGGANYTGPQLQDFMAGSTIDLRNFSAAGVTLSFNSANGLLQVSNGSSQVASLDFQTSTLGGEAFQVASDGNNGLLISHS